MRGDIATTLEQCLSQVESGRARVQSCLVSHPALAGELEPLLRTAEALRRAPKAELSPEAEARIAGVVMAQVNLAPRPEKSRLQRRPLLRLNRSWAFAALGAVLIVALLGSTGLAYAATDALPGSVLYPVKLATEALWLWVTPQREEAALHVRLAERRLAETEALARQGVVDPGVLQALAGHVDAAISAIQGMPEELALPLQQAVIALNSKEEQTLASLVSQVPEAARVHLQQALQTCRQQGRQMRQDVDSRRVEPGHGGVLPPGQVGTPPGQEARPNDKGIPPGQERVPPGQEERVDDEEQEAAEEEQEAAEEAAEEEQEAAEEEQEAAEEAAEEEQEAAEEAAEEEQEAAEEAAEEEQEAAEEAAEEEQEAAEEAAEEQEEEEEEEEEEAEEEEDKDKDKDKDK